MENSSRKGGLAAVLFFAAASLLCLWPVVVPWRLTTHLQTRDSALVAAIVGHFHEFLAGHARFWDMPIFYPEPNTLCLSEPFITAGVFTWPFAKLFGVTAACNLWLYFCPFAGALAMYAYLRHGQLAVVPSLWGGFVACYTPDLLFHSYSHHHLLFQAGFPLVLLATERMGTSKSRWWGILFGVTIAAQVLAGFYIALLFALWSVFMIPAGLWSAVHGNMHEMRQALRRHQLVVLVMLAILGAVLLPLLIGYTRYGKDYPQNPLGVLNGLSADWRGYLLPPMDPNAGLTAPGLAAVAISGPDDRRENTLFVGWVSLALVLAAPFLAFAVRHEQTRPQRAYWIAVIALALTSLILSLGPYIHGTIRLPYALLYAWIPSIRFLRVPARFAFVFQWCIALIGAHALNAIYCRLHARRPNLATALPVTALVLSVIEFFPLASPGQMEAGPSAVAGYLRRHKPGPVLELPTISDRMLVRVSQSQSPLANGYSGYSPLQREQELLYLDRNVGAPESVALLKDWGVTHLFVSAEASPSQRFAALSSGVARPVWSSDEGVLAEITTESLGVREYARRLRAGHRSREIWLVSDGHGTSESKIIGSISTIEFNLRAPIDPAAYSKFKLRIRSVKWYNLNERITLSWASTSSPRYDAVHAWQFCQPTDSQSRDVELDLGEFVPWLSSGDVTRLRIRPSQLVGSQISIESAVLVPAE